MLRLMRKGQSTAEYAIVIGLVIGAAVAMQIYVKRGLQAKMKDAVDYNDPDTVGMKVGGGNLFSGNSFEPRYMESEMVNTSETRGRAKTSTGGGVYRTTTGTGDISTRTGQQRTLNVTDTEASL